MIIYFSKINLATAELFELYKKEEVFQNVKRCISSFVKHGIKYFIEEFQDDENGVSQPVMTEYRLTIGNKTDDYITGVIYKETKLLYKKINEATDKLESHFIPTIEDISFYYDLNRELVGFHTRNRFGYQEFNIAFSEILNKSMEENNIPFKFYATLYNEGLQIKEIEEELKNIPNIRQLTFRFKAPNPADDYMLEELQAGLTDTVAEMEKANANSMSIIFDSEGSVGLNLESTEIKKNIRRIGTLNKGINDRAATKNGYALVKAIGKDGKIYTTEEHKPIKREIDTMDEFFGACRDTILSIFLK